MGFLKQNCCWCFFPPLWLYEQEIHSYINLNNLSMNGCLSLLWIFMFSLKRSTLQFLFNISKLLLHLLVAYGLRTITELVLPEHKHVWYWSLRQLLTKRHSACSRLWRGMTCVLGRRQGGQCIRRFYHCIWMVYTLKLIISGISFRISRQQATEVMGSRAI